MVVLYVALNAVFLYTTPMTELAGQVEVALIAGRHVFGEAGGRLVGAADLRRPDPDDQRDDVDRPARDGGDGRGRAAAGVFARRSRNGVPTAAILLQCGVASLLLLTQSFEAVLEFIQFGLIACSFLTVLGLIKLRITRPDLPRPYRAWGYPVTPLVFLDGHPVHDGPPRGGHDHSSRSRACS